jgi:hypothetical protein
MKTNLCSYSNHVQLTKQFLTPTDDLSKAKETFQQLASPVDVT